MNEQGFFNINEAAKMVGVSQATIRNWEKNGLIKSKRRDNNYRVFDFRDIETLKTIKHYSAEKGMTQKLIRELVSKDDLTFIESDETSYKKIHHIMLKKYREDEGYTLDEVAQAVGISASYLSRIEQGKANVSFEVLEKLAAFYGESTLRFFDIREEVRNEIVRNGQGKFLASGFKGVEIQALIGSSSSPLDVIRFSIQPGCGDFKAHSHRSGNEFIFVLTGQLEVVLDESSAHLLDVNDSIHFESSRTHRWSNPGKEAADIIWVHSYI